MSKLTVSGLILLGFDQFWGLKLISKHTDFRDLVKIFNKPSLAGAVHKSRFTGPFKISSFHLNYHQFDIPY